MNLASFDYQFIVICVVCIAS